MNGLLLLFLPVAATCGWVVGNRGGQAKHATNNDSRLKRDYFQGLNFLLNEQPDKAVDIFIKMLEVDSETVETHFALGNLFRRRGEVDRAIRIHQNLIARPDLDKTYRMEALKQLGQDYLRAGVFDRAERLFLEVVEMSDSKVGGLRHLLDIYQQEKDWEKAVSIAERLESMTNENMQAIIAHYYCELAEQADKNSNQTLGQQYLRRAKTINRSSARVSLLKGRLAEAQGNYRSALRFYQQVRFQQPELLAEAVNPICRCYEMLGQESEALEYLYLCLEQSPKVAIILMIAQRMRGQKSDKAAADFIATQLQRRPSLRGLYRLVQLQLSYTTGEGLRNLQMLETLIEKLLKTRPQYRCEHCGLGGKTLQWQCPGCKQWDTTKPIHGIEGDAS